MSEVSPFQSPSEKEPLIAAKNVAIVVIVATAIVWGVWQLTQQPHKSMSYQLKQQRNALEQPQYGQSILSEAEAEPAIAPLPNGVTIDNLPLPVGKNEQVLLYDLLAKKNLLLVFMPPSSFRTVNDFSSIKKQWQTLNVLPIVIVSPETLRQLPKSALKQKVITIADKEQTLTKHFGVQDPTNTKLPWPSVFLIKQDKTLGYQKALPIKKLLATPLINTAIKSHLESDVLKTDQSN